MKHSAGRTLIDSCCIILDDTVSEHLVARYKLADAVSAMGAPRPSRDERARELVLLRYRGASLPARAA